MYLDFKVKIPSDSAGITRKKIKGTTYIYYSYEHNYSSEKGYTVPKSTSIGKCTDDEPDLMYPNTNFLKFFPSEELPETKGGAHRSGCLRIGTYLVLRRIIAEYHLDEMIGNIIGKNSGLFLDLAVYSIIAENNAGQYYPDYAFNHPLFTDRMKIYSDSKVSAFINSITGDQSRAFLDEWNEKQGEFNSKFRNNLSFNKTLRKIKNDATDILDFLEKDYGSYNLVLFDKYYSKKDDKELDFVALFEKEIETLRQNGQVSYCRSMQDALKALKEFEDADLIKVSDDKIEVSQTGTMLIRNICMPFDAYLNKIPEDKRRFSKTI